MRRRSRLRPRSSWDVDRSRFLSGEPCFRFRMRSFIAKASFFARFISRSSEFLFDFFDLRSSRESALSDRDRLRLDRLRLFLDFSFFFLDSFEAERLRDRRSFFVETERLRRRRSGVLDLLLDTLRDRLSGVGDRRRRFSGVGDRRRRFSGVGDRRRRSSADGDRLLLRSGVRERLSFLISGFCCFLKIASMSSGSESLESLLSLELELDSSLDSDSSLESIPLTLPVFK